jgi:transcriptional regulator with XRE-family HTH domain
METTPQAIRFDTRLMTEDMTVKGWTKLDLANRAGVSDMTVIRFLRGGNQTARTAKKLSKALGHSVRRYIVSGSESAVA